MRRVALAKAVRLPGLPLRPAGFIVEVPDDVFEQFAPRGVFKTETDTPTVEPVEDAKPRRAVKAETPEVKRPARSADIDQWREFATAQGINPKGLTKQELIAATR